MQAKRFFVSGDVQGVGFRYFVLRHVQRRSHLKGFVRNLYDGRVEVYAEGEEAELNELESTLRQGPQGSWVQQLIVQEENLTGQYQDFRITFNQ
jgi:acylphosphatase